MPDQPKRGEKPDDTPAPPPRTAPDAEPTAEQVLDAAAAVDWGGDPSRLSG